MESGSMRAYQKTPMWNARLNRRMWKAYLPGSVTGTLYYASPLECPSLADLPDAYLETAELDPLRDEGIAYAEKLREAGVPVQHVGVEGAFHGYDLMKNSMMVKERMHERIASLQAAFQKVP
jgi:acetyl esterase/lipase